MPKSSPISKLKNEIIELTDTLQRTRADFVNYQKRAEQEKLQVKKAGSASAVLKLLPTIDNIERAISHLPKDLKKNPWAQSVVKLSSQLEKSLESLNLKKIDAKKGTTFDPNLHEAIQFDEDASGEKEIIAEELQAGYTLDGYPIRHAMVKVTKK